MDVAFGIFCVILFLILVLGPSLRRLFAPMLQRWMLGKMEDNMRRMAGMPTRKEEKKRRKQEGRKAAAREAQTKKNPHSTVGMLRHVAEDVEYTEIKEFGGDEPIGKTVKVSYRVEEQIEDADFTEIKEK